MTQVERRQLSDSAKQRFDRLADEWQRETKGLSPISRRLSHPSYLKIIGMGDDALPYLFRSLTERPDHWFYALNMITEENPVLASHRGNIRLMVEDWLAYGRDHGYV